MRVGALVNCGQSVGQRVQSPETRPSCFPLRCAREGGEGGSGDGGLGGRGQGAQ